MTHVVMRIRNTVLALLAVAAAGPGAAQTPAPDSVSAGLYAAAGAGMLSPAARRAVPFVYVPNSKDGTVTVIDPLTYRVLRSFATGALPQHVVPSYDLLTLWVANNLGNTLTPIDPANGREGPSGPGGSTSGTRTRWPSCNRSRSSAGAWTTWSSAPTGTSPSPRASSRAS